jgi:cobalt-precorrin 5A hydrolase
MKIAIIAFTAKGCRLARRIKELLACEDCAVYAPERLAKAEGALDCGSLALWTEARFSDSQALVFVSASGIAVRAIAPHVRDKLFDPAVIAADENGRHVIPLLSGHVGGANRLAARIASLISATAVISTATDINGKFSVDVWAADNGLALLDRAAAKDVSAALLEGGYVGFVSDFPYVGEPPEGLVFAEGLDIGISVSLNEGKRPFLSTLRLAPRILTVGIGCRRGTGWETIKSAVEKTLAENGFSVSAVRALASIDLKADEPGLLEYAGREGLPISFYSKCELAALKGEFARSDFVLDKTGVDNVCERAAAMGGGALVLGKRALDGVTWPRPRTTLF